MKISLLLLFTFLSVTGYAKTSEKFCDYVSGKSTNFSDSSSCLGRNPILAENLRENLSLSSGETLLLKSQANEVINEQITNYGKAISGSTSTLQGRFLSLSYIMGISAATSVAIKNTMDNGFEGQKIARDIHAK